MTRLLGKLSPAVCLILAACAQDPVEKRDSGSGAAGIAEVNSSLPPYEGGIGAGGYLHTDGRQIVDANGQAVRLTGINWFGFETNNYSPHGLWSRSLHSFLDQIEELGYNSIRLPFCSQLFDKDTEYPRIDAEANPDLVGLSGPELMDKVVEGAGERGLKIILDRHRPDSNEQSELWYTDKYSEERWISDWKMLAARYKGNPTVVGFDLHNEPHGSATWGDDNPATDWRLAAERAGNAILEVNPDLLIIVEGVQKYRNSWYWWGGNLEGVKDYPVRLKVANRLVYSAHDYPSTVADQAWFKSADYPENLPAVWRKAWGYLVEEDIAPVWLGEFGTTYKEESDKQWLAKLAQYIGATELSFAYWCLNPNSGDTGGILNDDWTSVNEDKQKIVDPLLAPLIL
jgi:endoglucanase